MLVVYTFFEGSWIRNTIVLQVVYIFITTYKYINMVRYNILFKQFINIHCHKNYFQ